MPSGNARRLPRGEVLPMRWWEELAVNSDQAEIQAEIARLIRLGEVRVRPRPGDPDRVEVIRCDPEVADEARELDSWPRVIGCGQIFRP
jgi:hypothetical protein